MVEDLPLAQKTGTAGYSKVPGSKPDADMRCSMDESAVEVVIKPRVLLVDDEESILNSLRRLLRSQGYELFLADSGARALEIMAEQPIDLVISDARMPNMDGATLLARIHALYPACLRILLTGYADLDMIAKAINEGRIYRYLSKPWNDEELLMTITQGLAFQHSERERQRLQLLVSEQNRQLQSLNSTLE